MLSARSVGVGVVAGKILAVAAIALLAVSGCSSSPAEDGAGTTAAAPASSASSDLAGTSQFGIASDSGTPSVGGAAAQTTDADFTLKLGDGTRLDGTLRLADVVAAGSEKANSLWSQLGGDGDQPCDADASRDGVFLGSIEFTNADPSFTPNLDLQFKQSGTGANYSFGRETSSGGSCDDLRQYPLRSDLQPTFSGASWGPVPIQIVVKDYYSPAHPNGDKSLLGSEDFYFISQAPGSNFSGYRVSTSSGLLSTAGFVNAPTFVRLRAVA